MDNIGENLDDLILYGSRAKGNAHRNSDYDVVIVLKHDCSPEYKNSIKDICYDIALKFNILFDTTIISKDELNRTHVSILYLLEDAFSEGIHIREKMK